MKNNNKVKKKQEEMERTKSKNKCKNEWKRKQKLRQWVKRKRWKINEKRDNCKEQIMTTNEGKSK